MVSRLLHAVPVCACAALLEPGAALAQPTRVAALSVGIPAQPLQQALDAFASQTGLELLYVSEIVGHRKSRPARAGEPPADALGRLLSGTGLGFQFLTPYTVRILSAAEAGAATPQATTPAEVIVTANRRAESVQDVPMSIQALTGDSLARLDVTTFDDLVAYLPGVTARGVGPAQNTLYIRGLGTGESGNQAMGSVGSFPNVAIYLDEQSAQLPGRNLDVYAADIERIEVLEGPQGTLFGAGAQAGALRYITNKPKLDATEAAVNASYAMTAHGAPSTAMDATLNVAPIPGTFAVRGVIYDEARGGYIDNIPATFARRPTDLSIEYAGANGGVPANSVTINNFALAARDINPVTYKGLRLEALYQLDADWSALLAQSYQGVEADGVFTEAASNWYGQPQPDLTVQLFNPSYNKDRFENTALTLEGRVGSLRVLYAGSYLVRNVQQVQDYTAYAHGGAYADYYQCANPGSTAATARCFSPSSFWRDVERNTHQTHELRIRTPDEGRWRAIGGLFYEDYEIQDRGDWYYLTAFPYFNPIAPPTGFWTVNGQAVCGCALPPSAVFVPGKVTLNDPNVRAAGDGFFNDITRGYKQEAVYASADFELIPHMLTATAGSRYFRTQNSEAGASVGSFGCSLLNPGAAPVPDPCIDREAVDLDALGLRKSYSGFRSRASLGWQPTEDALLYYTWSQGFRPGGFNRGTSTATFDSPLSAGPGSWQQQATQHKGWTPPISYAPDNVVNNELGWKTRWLHQQIEWNGAIYQEDWTGAQESPLGASLTGGVVFNGGNYRIRGIESSLSVLVLDGLHVDAGAAWNRGELVKEATFYWNDGTPINFNTLTTSSGTPFPNPAGTPGMPLDEAPTFQGNVRARYEMAIGGYDAFLQLAAVVQSHSSTSTPVIHTDQQTFELSGFTTLSAALGAGRDGWTAQLYAENLTDTRAQLYASYYLYFKAVTVNRPRTIGLRLSYAFGR